MKIYRISKCEFVNDLSGTGAAMYGGRWNSKGKYILYTAETASLALLETVAHMTNIASISYCMLCLEIPETSIDQYTIAELPANWQNYPPPSVLRRIGDEFLEKGMSLVLKLPSAIMPEECNCLLNPHHPDFKKVKVVYSKALPVDGRLVK